MSILNNSICVSNVGLQSRPATSPDETWGEGDGHCAPQTLAGQMGACTRTGGKRAIWLGGLPTKPPPQLFPLARSMRAGFLSGSVC